MLQYCNMETKEKWGNVRMEKTLIQRCEDHIARTGEYSSVSDFVSQKILVALSKKEVLVP